MTTTSSVTLFHTNKSELINISRYRPVSAAPTNNMSSSTKQNQESTVTFLPELITDILLQLPVKPLLRFRCVSKSTCSLIDDPEFAKWHLSRSMESKTNQKLILSAYPANDLYPTEISAANFDDEKGVHCAYKLVNPLQSVSDPTTILGSCNGLILLMDDDDCDDKLALWNPFTRRYKKLPVCPVEVEGDFVSNFGLGFDEINGDYKVVRILYNSCLMEGNDDFPKQVYVFSLGSNCWRRVQDLGCDGNGLLSDQAMFANGALHWLWRPKSGPELIVAFDLGNETFRTMPQPVYSSGRCNVALGALEGQLYMRLNSCLTKAEFYVGQMDGDEFIWRHLFSVTPDEATQIGYATPLLYSGKKNKVLMESGYSTYKHINWYDAENKRGEKVVIPGMTDWLMNATVCWESLVSLYDSDFDG